MRWLALLLVVPLVATAAEYKNQVEGQSDVFTIRRVILDTTSVASEECCLCAREEVGCDSVASSSDCRFPIDVEILDVTLTKQAGADQTNSGTIVMHVEGVAQTGFIWNLGTATTNTACEAFYDVSSDLKLVEPGDSCMQSGSVMVDAGEKWSLNTSQGLSSVDGFEVVIRARPRVPIRPF